MLGLGLGLGLGLRSGLAVHLARVAKQGGVCILEPVQGLDAEEQALRPHEVTAGAGAEPVVRRALKEPNVVGVVWQMGTDSVGYHALHMTRTLHGCLAGRRIGRSADRWPAGSNAGWAQVTAKASVSSM